MTHDFFCTHCDSQRPAAAFSGWDDLGPCCTGCAPQARCEDCEQVFGKEALVESADGLRFRCLDCDAQRETWVVQQVGGGYDAR